LWNKATSQALFDLGLGTLIDILKSYIASKSLKQEYVTIPYIQSRDFAKLLETSKLLPKVI
jgi:hypothetical protein